LNLKKENTVSVIIPNYNHVAFLKQRLESVYQQTYQDFEVILLDDASTDNSQEILETYRNHPKTAHVIYNEDNSGSPFKQWQKGIALAQGEYIWIAESDDYCELDFLEKSMNVFSQKGHIHVVFTGTVNVDENNKVVKKKSRIERRYEQLLKSDFTIKGHKFLNMFLPNYCIIRNVSSAVFKKSVVNSRTQKMSDYAAIGDFYFWISLCLENTNFAYISNKLNFMRKHEGTVRANKSKLLLKQQEYKKIHLEVFKARAYNIYVLYVLGAFYVKKRIKRLCVFC